MGNFARDVTELLSVPEQTPEGDMEEILKKIREALGVEENEEILASINLLSSAEKVQASEVDGLKEELDEVKGELAQAKSANEALKASINEMGVKLTIAAREDQLGRKFDDTEKEVIATMTDEQFALYAKAAKVVEEPRERKTFTSDDKPKTGITL